MKKTMMLTVLCAGLSGTLFQAQGTANDYARAYSLPGKYNIAVYYGDVNPRWMGDTHQFWYIRNTPEGEKYVIVDAANKTSTAMPDTMKQRILSIEKAPRPSRYWGEMDEERTFFSTTGDRQ